MEKSTLQRMGFLLAAVILLLLAVGWQPTVYGNDELSIKRYLYKTGGDRLGDHVRLLAVEDIHDDRIVIFRRETKRPDEVLFVRFRKNTDGNYEGYAPSNLRRMYCAHPGSGIWSEPISGWGDDPVVYYVVWSETPKLAEISFRLRGAEEVRIPVTEEPALSCFAFQRSGDWGISVTYYDAAGNEM